MAAILPPQPPTVEGFTSRPISTHALQAGQEQVAFDQLFVLESVCHLAFGEEATDPLEMRFIRRLKTQEQPCIRRKLKVGQDWQPLELGWVERPGMIVVRHDGPLLPPVQLSEAETAQRHSLVLQLGIQNPAFTEPIPYERIRIGEGRHLDPEDYRALRIRCLNGFSLYTCAAYSE